MKENGVRVFTTPPRQQLVVVWMCVHLRSKAIGLVRPSELSAPITDKLRRFPQPVNSYHAGRRTRLRFRWHVVLTSLNNNDELRTEQNISLFALESDGGGTSSCSSPRAASAMCVKQCCVNVVTEAEITDNASHHAIPTACCVSSILLSTDTQGPRLHDLRPCLFEQIRFM